MNLEFGGLGFMVLGLGYSAWHASNLEPGPEVVFRPC